MSGHKHLAPAVAALVLAACGPPTSLPPVELFGSLQGVPDSGAVIRQRILQRFPIGGPEAGLAEYLESQGLRTERRITPDAPYAINGSAGLEYGTAFRTNLVHVGWLGDSEGRLVRLDVSHGGKL